MDAIELSRWQTNTAWEWLELTVSDVTAAQAGWQPPGTANSIAVNCAHAVMWADVDINRSFFGREPLLISTPAIAAACDPNEPEEKAIATKTDWSTLRDYGRAVHKWMSQLVADLPAAEFDRRFQMIPERLGVWNGLDIFDLHGQHHVRIHGGEIACLKGLQGGRGYLGGADAVG